MARRAGDRRLSGPFRPAWEGSPIAALRELGAGVWALWRGASGLPAAVSLAVPFSERRLARALADYLWRPLPTVLTLAVLTGLIAGLLCSSLLKRLHAELAIIPPLAELLAGQVAPLLVGVFAAGRVCVAVTVKLGGMGLQGELDALTLQGREPGRFVLGPVLASLIVAAPVLTATASLAALLGVGFVLQINAVTPFDRFVQLTANPALAGQALAGVVRGYVFVLLALAAGGAAGSAPILDLAQLGQRTTATFTAGLLLIFLAAAMMAAWR